MRQRNMQDFVLHPEPCIGTNFLHPYNPSVNSFPNLEMHSLHDNNSMFYGNPEYHHQRASDLGAGMSIPVNIYLPYAAFRAPPCHLVAPGSHAAAVVGVTPNEHERNVRFMDPGYKRKSAEVVPGNSQYLSTAAASCSFPQLNTPETAPFSFPQFGTYPQPLDQRSVRNRAEPAIMDPLPFHIHDTFIQRNYAGHPFSLPDSIWYDQHGNGNRSDGSSSLSSQAPSVPYIHGNVFTGPIDCGNVCFPRYHETSSSRNPTPFVYTRHNNFRHHLAPPSPTVYPHMDSASYTVTETMHDASYSLVGTVQSTELRINQQHAQDDFLRTTTPRHDGLSHFRAISADEAAALGEVDLYDAVNYVDHHQDMRLDIEDMSYEELLALSDHIGTVKTGLSEEDVEDLLKRRTSISTRINLKEAPSTYLETDSCTICQENYKNQDKIATLDCRHEYHAECLKNWLVIKNVCPICKSEALVMEKKIR